MPELDKGGGELFCPPYKIGSQNTPYNLGLKSFYRPFCLFIDVGIDFQVQYAFLAVQYGFGRTSNQPIKSIVFIWRDNNMLLLTESAVHTRKYLL